VQRGRGVSGRGRAGQETDGVQVVGGIVGEVEEGLRLTAVLLPLVLLH
jgi:hypothetical protein